MSIRRIEASEWREVRELRLRALQDPNAAQAFIGTAEEASKLGDDFWIRRAADAAEGGPHAQFIAVADEGTWVGSATVLFEVGPLRASIVGVYVDPRVRGAGAVDGLMDACAAYAARWGLSEIFLSTHVDNVRARRAYERCGFVDTGERFVSIVGEELRMRRAT